MLDSGADGMQRSVAMPLADAQSFVPTEHVAAARPMNMNMKGPLTGLRLHGEREQQPDETRQRTGEPKASIVVRHGCRVGQPRRELLPAASKFSLSGC